jgi:hypothetical protein
MVAIEAAGTDGASDPAARRGDTLGARTRECGASNRDAGLRSTSTAVGAGSAVGLTAGDASVARGVRRDGREAIGTDAGRGVTTAARDRSIGSRTRCRACGARCGACP